MNKRQALSSTFLLAILFLSTLGFYAYYTYLKAQLIPNTQKYLESILDERSDAIYVYLDQQEKLIQTIAHDKKIVDIFTANTKKIDTALFESATKLYNELPTIKNILFIDNDGDILTSMENQDRLVGINIKKSPWNTSELSESFTRSSMTLTTDISGFEFNMLLKKPALFITTPIIAQNTLYGCIMFELDIEPIYFILRKYIGLKSTGEVTIGRIKDGKVMYIAPTRHSPNMLFKSLDTKNNTLENNDFISKHTMQRALMGEKGSGEAIDYRGNDVIAAWSYLTRFDWGIVAKIDTQEVLASTYMWYLAFLFCLFSALICFFLYALFLRDEYMKRIHMPNISLSRITRILLWSGIGLSIVAIIVNTYTLRHSAQTSITDMLEKGKKQVSQAIHLIDDSVNKVESTVHALADDLSEGKLSDALLDKRILTDLHENSDLIEITVAYEPYAHDANTRLYAFTIVHNKDGSFKKSSIADVYDYTKPSNPGEPESDWYVQAVQQGSVWPNPKNEPYTDLPSVTYSVPFFDSSADKKVRGVVSISYDLRTVQKIVDEIKIGETGYGFAMSRNGTLLAFPTKSYVSNQASFVTLAQEKANEKLMAIAEQALTAQEPLKDSFFDGQTNQAYSIYIAQTNKAHWSVAVIFADDEVSLSPLIIRRDHFFMVLYIIFGLICLIGLCCNIEQNTLTIMKKFATLITLVLIAGLLATWNIIIHTHTTYNPQKDGTIIVDQSRLNKFLNDVRENVKNSQSDEPQPLFMPTGVHIYSFSLPKIQQVALSGNIWQKLDLSLFKNVPKEIQLPQDITLSFKELTKSIEDNTEIRVSTFDTTIFNEQNFSQFPFDRITIKLNLSSQDFARNIILVPDLAAYDSINPVDKPGIDKEFTLPGFDIQRAFFSLKKLMPRSDFGLHSFRSITEHYELIYNVVIRRNLLNSFIIYILPLIVILIALFATLCSMREIEKYDPLRSLTSYASLFFGLILLHRTIREQYGVASTLYIEYAFFYTYITMLLLVIHAVVVYGPNSNKTFDDILTPLALYFYWPIQLSLWLATTIYLFY
jgi:hypothetical protein